MLLSFFHSPCRESSAMWVKRGRTGHCCVLMQEQEEEGKVVEELKEEVEE